MTASQRAANHAAVRHVAIARQPSFTRCRPVSGSSVLLDPLVEALAAWVAALEPNKYTLIIAVLAGIYVLLGAALDGVSIIVLTTSI